MWEFIKNMHLEYHESVSMGERQSRQDVSPLLVESERKKERKKALIYVAFTAFLRRLSFWGYIYMTLLPPAWLLQSPSDLEHCQNEQTEMDKVTGMM